MSAEKDAGLSHQAVVDPGAVGLEEAGAGRQGVEEEEGVLLPQEPVVALLGLRNPVLVLLELLVVREGDRVDTLRPPNHHRVSNSCRVGKVKGRKEGGGGGGC